jgi:hypothetical protein
MITAPREPASSLRRFRIGTSTLVLAVYWFGVNVTVLGEGYRNRSMGKRGSCGRLVELGAAKATHLAGGLKPGIARRPDCRATTSEAVGRRDVADRAV